MREQFFKKSIIKAGAIFFIGLIMAFCSLVYMALYIYTGTRNLTLPIILLFLGLILIVWGMYKIKVLGKITDATDTDID